MFASAILKLTAVCNLNCSYCYMFNLADRTHERVPSRMATATARAALRRIGDHAQSSGRRAFAVTLHGGEPTLWPQASFAALFDEVERQRERGIELELSLQTNMYRPLPRALVELLRAHRVSLGVSLDGPREANDRHRRSHGGHGSYDRVVANVGRLVADGDGDLLGGFLAVADPDVPAAAFLDWADRLPVRRVDVLWPIQHNHDAPPWHDGAEAAYARRPRYGEWFAELFGLWLERDDPTLVVRTFFDVVRWQLGSQAHYDDIVNDRLDMLVVNTDGGVEYPDYLRTVADGGVRTPFNVHDDALDAVARDELFAQLLTLGDHRPRACDGCRHVAICGGGFLPGRVRDGRFQATQRSVLCADQYRFFSAVEDALAVRTP